MLNIHLKPKKRKGLSVKEIAVFAMLGAIMCISVEVMEALPNVHLIGAFIVAITVVYRAKALYPIYLFVFLTGLINGFGMWWITYLYIWAVLWGVTMLLPKSMPKKIAPIVYAIVCALHGFLFGVMYAPAQALLFGLDFNGMITWIVAGLYFDFIHGISNFCSGLLIIPIISILKKTK